MEGIRIIEVKASIFENNNRDAENLRRQLKDEKTFLLKVLEKTSAVLRHIYSMVAVLLGWALFRTLSRNTYKRYQENRKFLQIFDRLKDRQHRYFDCPKCRQTVRVPRGKGKIAISCPKCGEKFIRKT